MKALFTLPLVLFMASGCGLLPKPQLADYQDQLSSPPALYQTLTKAHLRTILRDSSSAQFLGWTTPVPGYKIIDPLWPRVQHVGWYWTVAINSKNGFGARTGFRMFRFLLDESTKLWWSIDRYTSVLRPFAPSNVKIG